MIDIMKQGLGQARPNKALRKLTRVEEVKSRMDKKFSRIENLWPRDDSCSHLFRCVPQFSHFNLLADC